jgi:ATP-dependent Clp protease ATP-binding subunit ClpA
MFSYGLYKKLFLYFEKKVMLEFMDEGSDKSKKKNDSTTPVLDNFSKDLNKLAQDGKLDPVIGRQKEILRIAQILSRRKKNNPIIIGEPGCILSDTVIEVVKISNENSHNIEYM